MIKTPIDPIREDCTIEEAAAIFINSKIRFIPITDEDNQLIGIVTQQAIFKEYQKIFGQGYNPIMLGESWPPYQKLLPKIGETFEILC